MRRILGTYLSYLSYVGAVVVIVLALHLVLTPGGPFNRSTGLFIQDLADAPGPYPTTGEKVAEQAPGGRAIAHHAGGIQIRSRSVQGKAPVAELFSTGTQAAEPTLGVDEDGSIFYVGADYYLDPPNNPQHSRLEWPIMRSDDDGKTWTEVSPLVGDRRRHAHVGLDPMLHVDPRTGRVFTADLQVVACATVSFTDDKGDSWTTSEACGLADHQNVFTGPPVTSPTVGYPNIVYYCAIDAGALAAYGSATSCLKSLDGGITWARTGSPAFQDDAMQEGGQLGIPGHCGGATGHGVVDDQGTVYLPRGYCGQPYLAISRDEGRTWERIQVADNGMPFDEESQLDEHEAGVAVDSGGNLYYTWTARDRLIYLATSQDGGTTWSKPMMVGFPGMKETWGPTIAVGDPGKIALAYVGSADAPGGDAPQGYGDAYETATWNGYITMTGNALARNPVFYSGSVNDPKDPLIVGSCPIIRCSFEYDFIDIVIGPDGVPTTAMVDGYKKNGKPYGPWGTGIVGRLVGGPPLTSARSR